MRRWIARIWEARSARRQRRRERREYIEMRDVVAYLDDQLTSSEIEIFRIEAELHGRRMTRDLMRARRDDLERTITQTEVLYRSA